MGEDGSDIDELVGIDEHECGCGIQEKIVDGLKKFSGVSSGLR